MFWDSFLMCAQKSFKSFTFFVFPASSKNLTSFQQQLHDSEIRLFILRTTEGLVHNYYKRCERSQMLNHDAL